MTRPAAVTQLAEQLPTDPEIKDLDPVVTQQLEKREKGDWALTNHLKC
jgi:hypothetical protein